MFAPTAGSQPVGVKEQNVIEDVIGKKKILKMLLDKKKTWERKRKKMENA